MVQDPAASENLGGRQALVNFVNTICGAKLINDFYGAGAVHSDQNTADALCRFKGYLRGTITATGKYSTPHDNFIGTWRGPNPGTMGPFDPLNGELVVEGALTSNRLMDGLTCTGKVKAACIPKKQDIKCR